MGSNTVGTVIGMVNQKIKIQINLNLLPHLCIEIPVTVVMPVIAPIMKIENCKKYGATVVIFGQNLGESREKALQIAKEKDFLYINGYVIADIRNALIFYRPKIFCACPIFFGQTKNLVVFNVTIKKCASQKIEYT